MGCKVEGSGLQLQYALSRTQTMTLPETNMETQKGPCKDYSPSTRGLYGFPCSLGGMYLLQPVVFCYPESSDH